MQFDERANQRKPKSWSAVLGASGVRFEPVEHAILGLAQIRTLLGRQVVEVSVDSFEVAVGDDQLRRGLLTDAGYTRFRRVAETSFNIVYEARP